MEGLPQVLDRNIAALNAKDLDAYLPKQSPDVEFVLPPGVSCSGPRAGGAVHPGVVDSIRTSGAHKYPPTPTRRIPALARQVPGF
jgi:hypothetical protein